MEETLALICERVSEEYQGHNDCNVDSVQDTFLDSMNAQKVLQDADNVNRVHTDSLDTRIDVDKLQNKSSDNTADVDRVQVDVLNAGPQDEALKSSLDVDKDVLQMSLDETSGQGKVLELGVLDQVFENIVDADNVQEGLFEGDLKSGKNEVLVEGVQPKGNMNINPFIESDINLEDQKTIDKNKDGFNKALEKVLEIPVDVNEVLNTQTRMDSMRCQVKITTRHSLQLHMANHTARDVYVRLLNHGERISGKGLLALKDSVHLSPLKASLNPGDTVIEEQEDEETEEDEPAISDARLLEKSQTDEQNGSLTISDMAYSPCVSAMPTPMEEARRGVDFLFQSPGHLLKELHDDPETQAELRAERERELVQEAAHQCSPSNSRPELRAFLNSTARLVVVALAVLLLVLILLLVLLESSLEVSFLQDIRQTPEFEQFHYEYYCPLRRWLCYKFVFLRKHLWGD